MTPKVVSTGDEPAIRNVIRWLESRGIKRSQVKAVTIHSKVGEPLVIITTIIVEDPAEMEDQHEITTPGDTERIYLQPDGTRRSVPYDQDATEIIRTTP